MTERSSAPGAARSSQERPFDEKAGSPERKKKKEKKQKPEKRRKKKMKHACA